MASKYKAGDTVHCYRTRTSGVDFDFKGEILSATNVGYPEEEWEYRVENAPMLFIGAPCLIWEEEIIGVVEKE